MLKPILLSSVFLLVNSAQNCAAAESSLAVSDGNKGQVVVRPTPPAPVQSASRIGPMFEVESVIVRANDAVGMAQWAELAGQGYHLVSAIPQSDGGALLLLERMANGRGELTLPQAVAADFATAGAVRAKVQAYQAERLRPMSPAPAAPVTAPKP